MNFFTNNKGKTKIGIYPMILVVKGVVSFKGNYFQIGYYGLA